MGWSRNWLADAAAGGGARPPDARPAGRDAADDLAEWTRETVADIRRPKQVATAPPSGAELLSLASANDAAVSEMRDNHQRLARDDPCWPSLGRPCRKCTAICSRAVGAPLAETLDSETFLAAFGASRQSKFDQGKHHRAKRRKPDRRTRLSARHLTFSCTRARSTLIARRNTRDGEEAGAYFRLSRLPEQRKFRTSSLNLTLLAGVTRAAREPRGPATSSRARRRPDASSCRQGLRAPPGSVATTARSTGLAAAL